MAVVTMVAVAGILLAAALYGWAWRQRGKPSGEWYFVVATVCLVIGLGGSFVVVVYMNIMWQGGL